MSKVSPSSELIALARSAARSHSLPPELVCAVIEQESSWDCWAMRYEPAFYDRYIAPRAGPGSGAPGAAHLIPPAPRARISGDTEARARAFSWGLMQVMGQVAREHGFAGDSLAALCDPATGLGIGCAVLAAKMAAAGQDVAHALSLWNGGANPNYPAEVMARITRY